MFLGPILIVIIKLLFSGFSQVDSFKKWIEFNFGYKSKAAAEASILDQVMLQIIKPRMNDSYFNPSSNFAKPFSLFLKRMNEIFQDFRQLLSEFCRHCR